MTDIKKTIADAAQAASDISVYSEPKGRKTYTAQQLIENICEKSFRNSKMNHTKLTNCGLERGVKYDLGNNTSVSFEPHHGGITKNFWWGARRISRLSALRHADLAKVITL